MQPAHLNVNVDTDPRGGDKNSTTSTKDKCNILYCVRSIYLSLGKLLTFNSVDRVL